MRLISAVGGDPQHDTRVCRTGTAAGGRRTSRAPYNHRQVYATAHFSADLNSKYISRSSVFWIEECSGEIDDIRIYYKLFMNSNFLNLNSISYTNAINRCIDGKVIIRPKLLKSDSVSYVQHFIYIF